MSNSNYPSGAEHDPRAPWNQQEASAPEDILATKWGDLAREQLLMDAEEPAELWLLALGGTEDVGSRPWLLNVTALALTHERKIQALAEKLWEKEL